VLVADIVGMLDPRRFPLARPFRKQTGPPVPGRILERRPRTSAPGDEDGADDVLVARRGIQLALPRVRARCYSVEPGSSRVRSWAGDRDVSIVMLSGSLALATANTLTVLQRDDLVALGAHRRYELANPPSGELAWFIELATRRDPGAPAQLGPRRITVDRRPRVRSIVELMPTPQISAVILCAGDAVTHELGSGRAAAVVSTVGTIALNDLQVDAVSVVIVRGPGRVRLRAIGSTEVLLVSLPASAGWRRGAPHEPDQLASTAPS
jgi:hypothetical protein